MNKIKLGLVLSLAALLGACSFGKNTVNVEEVKKVKKVAVIMYTVPEDISYKSDVRDNQKSSLQLLADLATGNTGKQAANTSVKTFTEELQKQGLPFEVMSYSEVASNPKYAALYKPVKKIEKKANEGILGAALSFLGSATDNSPPPATSPKNMSNFGLVAAWSGDTALTNKPGESAYITAAMEALKVDAVMVVNSSGYSFSCEACVGLGSTMNGAASTGAAFNASLISRAGPIMNIREWFGTTDEQAAMVAGIVDPTEYENLFKEHGRRMAQVYADAVKESLQAK
ncbi:MAG: hypothetical protein OEM07_00995 [Gammaproteobacteria bacterium]|nr:hypothetical protein [Gammaproteobacteria bacterium]